MTARNLVMAAAGYSASTGGPGTVAITGSTTSTWNPASAPLSLATAGTYYLTPSTNIVVSSKMWGAAGGSCQNVDGNRGGAGGFSSGTITLLAGQTYTVIVGGGGAGGNINAGGGGGGFSGIFETTTVSQATAWLMAGGGGGGLGDNGAGYPGGAAGGGTSGQNGLGWRTSTTESGGQGGTQFAGGAASSGTGVPVAGSALQGGTSGSRNVAGGTPGGGGAGSNGYGYDGGGGGGGYYGGGPGASGNPSGKSFGGGGSGFVNQGKVVNGTTITGARVTPANSTDADRGTAGQPVQNGNGNPGKVVLTYVSTQGTTDTQFNNVSLLLHGDGTNGAQNNTFLSTIAPAAVGSYATYVDGTGDYVLTSSSSALTLGTGDFTIELWLFQTAYSASTWGGILGIGSKGGGNISIMPRHGGSNNLVINTFGGTQISTGTAIATNTWYHIAISRISGTLNVYVNGTRVSSSVYSDNLTGTQLVLGRTYTNTDEEYITGYVSNVRVIKGTGIYSGTTIIVPTSTLTAVSGTTLLTCQNATLIDNSTSALTLTAYGNSTVTTSSSIAYPAMTSNGTTGQGTFSPYGSTWSNYFDGTGDYLTVPAGSAFAYGTGDFTVEGWFYATADVPLYGMNLFSQTVSGTNYFMCTLDSPQKVYFVFATSGGGTAVSSGSVTYLKNTWNHFAVVRSSGSVTVYLNGVGGTPVSCTQDFNNTTYVPTIGTYSHTQTNLFTGYLSNFRVIKGTAVYTSNFTPATGPLTAISGTSLLTCQSNRFVDNSANNFTITRNGDVRVTKEAPFKPVTSYDPSVFGGSVYVNGSGSNVLTTSSDTSLAVGTNPYTIEGWFYFTGSSVGTLDNFFGCQRTSFSSGRLIFYYSSGSLQLTPTGGSGATSGSITLVPGQWYHIAGTRDASNNQRLFVNGTLLATTTNTTNYGEDGFGINGYSSMTGYVSDARLIVGTALYTANFTPPTSPLTAVTNTKILLKFTNASVIDNAAENNIVTVGTAQINTTTKKYGTGSIYFDGSSGYLSLPLNNNFNFGSGDFTLEFWMYSSGVNTAGICSFPHNGSNYGSVLVYGSGSNTLAFYSSSSGSSWDVSGGATIGTITLNAWNHVAICRQGSSIRLFVNGTLGNTVTYSGAFTGTYVNNVIGKTVSNGYYSGYIDDFRITKGFARYTANFTPPTAAFPDQ